MRMSFKVNAVKRLLLACGQSLVDELIEPRRGGISRDN